MDDRRPTLLVVDDEEENLIVLAALLDRDYRLLTARGADEALALLDRNRVDVLITDQRMPRVSGIELVKEARLRHPDVVRIVLTAYTDVDVMLEAVNEGSVYRFVIKPWSVELMRATIRHAIEWASIRREHGELAAELQRANRELGRRNEELTRMRTQLVLDEKLAAVGRYAAEMMHEMGNHLMVVDVLSQELGSETESERTRETVRMLREQTEQLVAISRDIRQFASGARLEPDIRPVEPHLVVEQVAEMCRRIPSLRHAEILVEAVEVGSWALDRPKLLHLLSNLIRNALQASPPGEVVRVRLGTDEDKLVITVEDRGPGIPNEALPHLFEPFFTTKGEGGTGLGLTICQWVTEMHGGTIEVSNIPGGGARFTVVLPWRTGLSARAPATPREAPEPGARTS